MPHLTNQNQVFQGLYPALEVKPSWNTELEDTWHMTPDPWGHSIYEQITQPYVYLIKKSQM